MAKKNAVEKIEKKLAKKGKSKPQVIWTGSRYGVNYRVVRPDEDHTYGKEVEVEFETIDATNKKMWMPLHRVGCFTAAVLNLPEDTSDGL